MEQQKEGSALPENDGVVEQESKAGGAGKNTVDYETYNKAVGREKKVKAEALKYKEMYEEKLEQEQKAQGKWKEIAEAKDKQLNSVLSKLKNTTVKVVVERELTALGINPSFIEKAAKLVDVDGISFDPENYSEGVEQLKFQVQKLKEEVPVLFKRTVSKPRDGVPADGITAKAQKDIKKMSNEDLDKLYAKA